MITLTYEYYPSLRPLANSRHLALVIEAMIAHPIPAMVWVDDLAAPRSAFVWDRAYCYYFLGEQAPDDIARILHDIVLPQARADGRRFAKFNGNLDYESVLPEIPLQKMEWRFYTFDQPHPDAAPLPDGYRLQPIDADLLANTKLAYLDNLLGELWQMWNCPQDFLTFAFGYCVLHEESIACWCTAEYVSEMKCGIGIETAEAHRRRGLATAAAVAVVRESLSRGLTPHWDCLATNLPSNRVAEKVGFTLQERYDIYLGRLM